MSIRASSLAAAALLAAAFAFADNGPPLASVWNIAPTGSADSSGALRFRVKPDDGEPVDISVPVIMGANAETIARGIRRSLSSQLAPGSLQGAARARAPTCWSATRAAARTSPSSWSNSDVDNLRVAVQSVTPSASPTVPKSVAACQRADGAPPANDAPGDVVRAASRFRAGARARPVRPPSDSMPVPCRRRRRQRQRHHQARSARSGAHRDAAPSAGGTGAAAEAADRPPDRPEQPNCTGTRSSGRMTRRVL